MSDDMTNREFAAWIIEDTLNAGRTAADNARTLEQLLEQLEECADEDTYFEINGHCARVLWNYIQDLNRQINDAAE